MSDQMDKEHPLFSPGKNSYVDEHCEVIEMFGKFPWRDEIMV